MKLLLSLLLLMPSDPAFAMKSIELVAANAAAVEAPDGSVETAPAKLSPTQSLVQQLSQKFPGARVALTSAPRLLGGVSGDGIVEISLQSEDGGVAKFRASDADGNQFEGVVSFQAWTPAWVASKRILPGERVTQESLQRQEVNAAVGMAREMRGLIVSGDSKVSSLEARQTVLEGQFLTTSAVQKMPDVKKGDAVRIRMTAGAITLTTTGTATEPGYLDQPIRVMTQKSKRDLVGKLSTDGTVEVQL